MKLTRHQRWVAGVGMLLLAGMVVFFEAWKLRRAIIAVVLVVVGIIFLVGPGGKTEDGVR